jgi:polyhydroxybutyrate depolymerase
MIGASGASGTAGPRRSVGASGASGTGGGQVAQAGAGTQAQQPVAGDAGRETGVDRTDADSGSDAAVGGADPDAWGPGDYPPGITEQTYLEISGVSGQGGNVRQYKVHVPPSYDANVPMPVVFCIHGLMEDPVMFCVNGAALPTKADEAGFILIMPNGYERSWNAGTCCGEASNSQLDDVALFRAIFEEVGRHVNIDLGRVYATGLSNGGYMSYRLACEAADIFTAVAPGAGAIGTNDLAVDNFLLHSASEFTACEPSRPISVLDIHGTADALIPYELQSPSLMHMVARNNCSTTTQPSTEPQSAGDTSCVSYTGCPNGIEVIGCSIDGGGHCWFGSPDCGTGAGDLGTLFVGANSDTMVNNDAVWNFFRRFSR